MVISFVFRTEPPPHSYEIVNKTLGLFFSGSPRLFFLELTLLYLYPPLSDCAFRALYDSPPPDFFFSMLAERFPEMCPCDFFSLINQARARV